MEIPQHRRWMVNRLKSGRVGYTQEFINGVEEFDAFAKNQPIYLQHGMYRCPCALCQNTKYKSSEEVKLHLFQKGFVEGYWYWTCHGETEPQQYASSVHEGSSSMMHEDDDVSYVNPYQTMIEDAILPEHEDSSQEDSRQPPNADAQSFYDLLESLKRPLWDGCPDHTELSVAVRLMSIKSDFNMSQECFNQVAGLMREVCPVGNRVPQNFSEAKKIVKKLSLTAIKIDCCPSGCMLYFKENANLEACKFCNHPRRKASRSIHEKSKEVPFARMHYLPLIPRLQRLYASRSSAQHMMWHHETSREGGIMCHPCDGEAWKNFDKTYPDFAAEPRNVRLGVCTDGFSPYSLSSKAYSCWPVIVTPYNLPPELCMTMPYMFLTCIIPGPKNPKDKIDIYLQPLIDELQMLWKDGVATYDVHMGQNFRLRAALMWTINDFPAYGMLSGWSTHGKLACPVCMNDSHAFTLKHGGKPTWFDCHRRFLPMDHPFRRNKDAFRKNKIEKNAPPVRLDSNQLSQIVSELPKITDHGFCRINGFGESHNWTKQSIFWELPYWKDNLIRHNLDVMHIEKNFFDNVFNTIMDIKEKTKDNVKARLDMGIYCRRKELELKELDNGKLIKPKSKFTFTLQQKLNVCNWIKELRMPDGYASNISNCVDLKGDRLSNMKSHDCHVFMETLLPIAFSALPEQVLIPLAEISQFFKSLCSTVLRTDLLRQMEENIPHILCKLERIFPPGFFNCMEHLPIHLAYEAKLGGPVQYRWMYPFERFLGRLKKMVKNKARVEGSICEAYLCQETSYFCSYYFESHVPSMRTRGRRNEFYPQQEGSPETLSVFRQLGRHAGKQRQRYLSAKEVNAAHLHILLNCAEVAPYIDAFAREKRTQNPHISDKDIDASIAVEFASWFRQNVSCLQLHDDEHHRYLCQLAMGLLKCVNTWPIYFVNGYKFQTEERNQGKKTFNCGVCVKGVGEDDIENYYYGILKDIIEVEYPGEPIKKCTLFSCDWFDPTLNHGVRIHKYCGFAEVRRNRRYMMYDPFIFANSASQVYYMPYPEKTRDKANWLVVVPTKPRARVDNRFNLEVAYQEDNMTFVDISDENAPIETLSDDLGVYEQVMIENEVEEQEDDDHSVEIDIEGEQEEDEFDDLGTSSSDENMRYQSDEDEDDDNDY